MFEGIYGVSVSRDESDRLTFPIRKEWREFEVSLMHAKWFDYRHLTAAQATYLFAHHYRLAFKAMFRRHVDRDRAEHVRALKHEDLFQCSPQVVSGVWRARQHADALCMPYEVYLADALDCAMNVHREHLPRPTQLYTDRIVSFVQGRWLERQRATLYVAQADLYRNERYRGLPQQNAHHEWLFSQIGLRGNPGYWLGSFIRQSLLPVEKVVARYGDNFHEILEDA